MVQLVSGKITLLVRFQVCCEKDMTLNQLTVLIVYSSAVAKAAKVPMIYEKYGKKFYLYKGYYHGVHGLLTFNK